MKEDPRLIASLRSKASWWFYEVGWPHDEHLSTTHIVDVYGLAWDPPRLYIDNDGEGWLCLFEAEFLERNESMKNPCIITGCDVYADNLDAHARADLYEVGDCYLIVCNRDEDGQVYWLFGKPRDPKRITIDTNHALERKGMLFIPKDLATLSPEAEAYIARANT